MSLSDWGQVPNIDNEVQGWVYGKAEPYILDTYKGLNKIVVITRRKDWKRPAAWAELDMDVFFVRIAPDTPPEDFMDVAAKSEESHVKLLAHFKVFDDGNLEVTGELVDWLDGHSITRRTWKGILKRLPDGRCKLEDIPEAPPPPPTPHRRFRPSNRPQYT